MKQSPDPNTIVTAQSHPVFHQGLRRLIAGYTRFQLLGGAGNGGELLELVARHRPHLVVIDVHLPGIANLEICHTIRRVSQGTGILALCSPHSDEVLEAVKAGVSACLHRDRYSAELLPALQAVSEGRLHGNTLMKNALKQLHTRSTTTNSIHFTSHELQVINLICRQLSGREIAQRLSLSLPVVEEIRSRVQEKIGVRSGVGIALYALQQGLVRTD